MHSGSNPALGMLCRSSSNRKVMLQIPNCRAPGRKVYDIGPRVLAVKKRISIFTICGHRVANVQVHAGRHVMTPLQLLTINMKGPNKPIKPKKKFNAN